MADEKGYLTILLNQKTGLTSFVFHWECLKEPEIKDLPTPISWIKHYVDHFRNSLNELIFEDVKNKMLRGTGLEQRLIALGYDVWEIFPGDLQKALRQFDKKARGNGILASKSRLVLIIRTNIFFVPWELCVAPKQTKEESPAGDPAWFNRSWGFKYHVVLIHASVPPPQDISNRTEVLERERNRVLLVRELPSPYDREYADILCKEYGDIVNKLETLIKNLKDRGIEIDDEGYRDRFELAQKLGGRGNQRYDMILFMGGFVEKKGLDELGQMQVIRMKKPLLMDVAEIKVDQHLKPVVFLDACKTCDVSYSSVEEYIECGTTVAGRFIRDGACAFIGTLQKVEPEVAALFALEFLNSVYNYGSSLAKAMHDARRKTYQFFSEARLKSRSSFFRLCGRRGEEELVTDSFRFGFKRSSLKLIYYPEASGEYFNQFNIDIYPSSIPGVELVGKVSFSEVEKAIPRVKDPFIADVPTISAARMMSESKKTDKDNPLIIVGSLLRVRRDLSTSFLYYIEDESLDFLKNSLLEHPGDTSMVTIMALMYFQQLGLVDRFLAPGRRKAQAYSSIFEFAKECIESGHTRFLFPFVLASGYETEFAEFLEEEIDKGKIVVEKRGEVKTILKVKAKRGKEIKLVRVDLNRFFFHLSSCRSMQSVPAQVLIARKKDYDENYHLYREVVTKWENWRRNLLQYTDIARSQDVIVSFTDADKQAIIAFIELVAKEIGRAYVRIGPLTKEDFYIIRPWGEMGEDFEFSQPFGELKNKCKETLGELYAGLEKLEHVRDLTEGEAKTLLTINRAESKKMGQEISTITNIMDEYNTKGQHLKNLIDEVSDFHQLQRTLQEIQELVKEFERTSRQFLK